MKYVLVAISVLLMSCASKPAKIEPDAAKAPTATEADGEAATKAKMSSAKSVVGDVNCSYGEIKRSLRITNSPDRCTVQYTKDSDVQEIGTGAANSTFCNEIVERVKNNLTAAGYKCN